jgi:3-phytase
MNEPALKPWFARASAMAALAFAAACATGDEPPILPPAGVAMAPAFAETVAVASRGDAADDPAFWINFVRREDSRILGTDKKAGLHVYDLSGQSVQFIASGALNNVDVREGVVLPGLPGDLAAASNRTDNTITFFSIDRASGVVSELARLPTGMAEPYGFCLAWDGQKAHAFVPYKTGLVQRWIVTGFSGGQAIATAGEGWKLSSQLEGCVADEANGTLFIGEEGKGVWRAPLAGGDPISVDQVGSQTGLTADVEGLAIWAGENGDGYLLVSSQGSSTVNVYQRKAPNAFVGRFAVASGPDVVTGSDGLDVTSAALGRSLPAGVFAIQDDVNTDPAGTQNFKFVDWREIASRLGK